MNNSHGIVKTIGFNEFLDEFSAYNRLDNFSYEGKQALFEWIENYAHECDEAIELDVIALCCEYSELSADDVIQDYCIDLDDSDDKDQIAQDYLNDNTMLVDFYDIDGITYYLFQNF